MSKTILEPLGVGINYSAKTAKLIAENRLSVDFIEVSPDTLCSEVFINGKRSFEFNPQQLNTALPLMQQYPVVVHGLGLSIGSASGWNLDYIRMLEAFGGIASYRWHSEHLGFCVVEMEDGSELHAGTLLPVPFSEESLSIVAPRIKALQKKFDKPFLIENTAYYLPNNLAHQWDEVDFLNELTWSTGCGLLLDIYNFYCNAKNFGFDPFKALSKLHMEPVTEIHLAGGVTHEGFLMDVHSEKITEDVWVLLEWVLNCAPNVKALTYEVLDEAVDAIGYDSIGNELQRLQKVWVNYQTRQKRKPASIKEHDYAIT